MPAHEVILRIEGKRTTGGSSRDPTVHVAPGIIGGAVVGGAGRATGGTAAGRSERRHLMRMSTATIEILLLCATTAQWTLPELTQVGVDVGMSIAASKRGLQAG